MNARVSAGLFLRSLTIFHENRIDCFRVFVLQIKINMRVHSNRCRVQSFEINIESSMMQRPFTFKIPRISDRNCQIERKLKMGAHAHCLEIKIGSAIRESSSKMLS